MDLIEVEVLAEQCAALRDLSSQRGQRVILHLKDAGLDVPVTDVGVAPLRSHGDGLRREAALAKPRRQEALRKAVGAGGVEVADTGVIGSAQDLVGSALQGGHTSIASQILRAVERDVAGSTQRRQAAPDRRHPQPGGAERPKLQAGGPRYGCWMIRAFSSWNSASQST